MSARLPCPTASRSTVEFKDGAIEIDAAVVSAGLGLEPHEVLDLMRSKSITGVWEHGIDDDAGRYRLTFFYRNRRLRLIVDDRGGVVRRSAIDFGERPMPAQMHRTGE